MAALNTVYVLLAIAVVCCQSARLGDDLKSQFGKDEKNDINIQLKIEQDSKLYHKGAGGRFEYGLDVPQPERDQYQHKEHRVDDVTYGCFGHVDPEGGEHNTLYVSGSFGYRPLYLDGKNYSYTDIDEELHWKNFPEECYAYIKPPTTDPPTITSSPETPPPETTLGPEITTKTPEPTPPKTTTTTTTPAPTTPSTTRTTPKTTPTTTPAPTTPSPPRTTRTTPSTTTPPPTTPSPPRTTRTTPTTSNPEPTTPTTTTSTTSTTTEQPPPTTTPRSKEVTREPPNPSTNCISEDAAKQIESVIDMLENLLKSPRCPDKCDSGDNGDDSSPKHVLLPLVLVDKLHGKSGIPVGSKFAIPSVSHEQTKNV